MKDHSVDKDIEILPLLWSWKRKIIWSVLIAITATSLAVILMPNYYKATALFYPVNESLQNPIVGVSDARLSLYGNDNDVDRLLSIAKSHEIKRSLIGELNLFDHYKLTSSEKKDQIALNKKILKHYGVMKTEFDAIEISFEDQDPDKAALFANTALDQVNAKAISISDDMRSILLSALQNELDKKREGLKTLTENIKLLKEKYNIYDTEYQAEAFATLEMKSPNSTSLKKRIDDYTSGVSELKQLEVQQNELSKILVYEQNQLDKLKANASKESTAIHIIERATAPIEKSRPKRSLYVIASGLIGFIFSCLTIVTIDALKRVDWSQP